MSAPRVIDHVLAVPLDHDAPAGPAIDLFVREVAADDEVTRPYLVFLQGGPGGESPRLSGEPGWLHAALRDFRVLLVDQRGTGRSSPVGEPSGGAVDAAAYLTHFRADSIVRDCEALREHLGVRQWTVLGQSFGGFCALHYLSTRPQSLAGVLFAGGLPPVGVSIEEVYAATYAEMGALSREWAHRFPGARDALVEAVRLAEAGRLRTLGADPIGVRRLLSIGGGLGMGKDEVLRDMFDFAPDSTFFRADVETQIPFSGRNPLYSLLQEACYADGETTRWAAARVLPHEIADDPTMMTGEHLFPEHFQESSALRPWLDVAQLLAKHPWPRLYDAGALAGADVRCAAVVYPRDPFVPREHSLATAALLPRMRAVELDLPHNALRTHGDAVIAQLLESVAEA